MRLTGQRADEQVPGDLVVGPARGDEAQFGQCLGRGRGDLLQRGQPVTAAGFARPSGGGRGADVDRYQRVPNRVVQLVGQREPLGVETVLRRLC